jgi:leader peptidase (prepilin peptidase) / N-methyltransferase
VTLTWIIGGAAVGVLAGPPVRAGVLARYAVAPPALAVEAAAGLALAVTAARAASPWQLAGLGWLMLCAVALAFVDAAIRRLPDPLTGAAFAGTLGLLAVAALTGGGHPGQLGRAVIAAAVLCGFYLALFIVRPSGMGLGDVKLAASIGVALGWLGWQALVEGTFLTFALAAVYGVALLLLRRASRTSQLPLGPFIVLGTLAAIAALPVGSRF